MADKKPRGPAAAANEIICLPFNHRNGTRVNLKFLMQNEKQGTTESIEAIIAKHCPEDKAGKLVEALKSIASVQSPEADPRFYELNGGSVGVIAKMVKEAQTALADDEEAK